MITKRFYHLPNDNCFIFGPKGTGKSTWIKNYLPQAYVINLLDEQNYLKFITDPSRIKAVVRGNLNYKQFVIAGR